MSIRLKRPFRAAVAEIRPLVEPRDRALFDLICAAGELGHRLSYADINLGKVAGRRDPRKRLLRILARRDHRKSTHRVDASRRRSSERLSRLLVAELSKRKRDEADRAPHVLFSHAPSALAPDCIPPLDPDLRAAWKTLVQTFASLFPSRVKPLGRLEWLDRRKLAILRREAAAGMRRGRSATGQTPGPQGRALAVDPKLMLAIGEVLGTKASPGYEARYIFYTKPGDHFWPHPDDPEFALNVLVCLDRELPPDCTEGSAFLAYRPDDTVERYELAPGEALVAEAHGVVHGREPLRRGERILLLSIGLNGFSRKRAAASR